MENLNGKLIGLDLFSGYAGITLALGDYVRPVGYCEIEKYAQGILLSRMDDGSIPFAPIWSDVTKLDGSKYRGLVKIIYGGAPCQDISVAGKGAGLAGERSGLFYEIIRLTKEINPAFVFLENVPAIRTRGLHEVISAFREVGYDCRWTCLSASSVGAPHKRERWFLLAHSNSTDIRIKQGWSSRATGQGETLLGHNGTQEPMADTNSMRKQSEQDSERITSSGAINSGAFGGPEQVAHSYLQRCSGEANATTEEDHERIWQDYGRPMSTATDCSDGARKEEGQALSKSLGVQGLRTSGQQEPPAYDGEGLPVRESKGSYPADWETFTDIRRVVDGPSVRPYETEWVGDQVVHRKTKEPVSEEDIGKWFRAERIKACGNGVVPLQVKVAFERLMGIGVNNVTN